MSEKVKVKIVAKKLTPLEIATIREQRRNEQYQCCRDTTNVIKQGSLNKHFYQAYKCKVCNRKLYSAYEPTEEQVRLSIITNYNDEVRECENKIKRLEWLKKCCRSKGVMCQYPDDSDHNATCTVCGTVEVKHYDCYWW
jgi:hypothetical protein